MKHKPSLQDITIHILMILIILSPRIVMGQKNPDIDTPVLKDSTVNLFKAGDFYLSGQPTKEVFKVLADEGVTQVINIRTREEVEFHDTRLYPEKDYVEKLGMDYLHVEVGGDAGFTPEAVGSVAEGINNAGGKILIHCRGAGRATIVWMAWLINYNNYSINKAVDLGKNAQFSMPLEELLGYQIKMKPARNKR